MATPDLPDLPEVTDLPRKVNQNSKDIYALYELVTQVDRRVARLDRKFDTKFDGLDTKVNQLDRKFDTKFDELHGMLAQVLQRLGSGPGRSE